MSLCSVLSIAEAPPSPLALWNKEVLPDHWLNDQLYQARWFWHDQLCHSIQIRIRTTHQDQLTRWDSGIRSSQSTPVHLEMANEFCWVFPLESGIKVQARRHGLHRRTGTTQPHHVIDAQVPNLVRRYL